MCSLLSANVRGPKAVALEESRRVIMCGRLAASPSQGSEREFLLAHAAR
jgi:hypothetical protein